MKTLKKESIGIESKIRFDSERDNIIVDTWNVYTSNDVFEKVFGKKAKELKTYSKKKKIIKITSLDSKRTIYRIWNGAPLGSKTKNTIFLDKNAKYDLLNNKDSNTVTVVISKGTKLLFYWNHYDHMTRVSFKLALWSVILGIISFILGSISIVISLI